MQSDSKKNSNIVVIYFIVLAAAGVLYIVTGAPGTLWQDSGMIQYRVWHNDIEGKLGLALAHPLFYILAIGAKYIPLGEFAHRVNLVSACAGAFAIANLFLLLRLWLGSAVSALFAALTLAISHTFWQHAAVAETYTLYNALLLAELIMLLQYVKTARVKYLYWLGLFNGLAVADHMLGSIALACYIVFFIVMLIKKQLRLTNILIIAVLWVIGALPYEYLIIKQIVQSGDIAATLRSAAFGSNWAGAVLNTSLTFRIVKEDILFILLNFPTPGLLLFFAGLAALYKRAASRAFGNIILALLILFFLFGFRYTVPDRYAFFIPFYVVVSILIGVGFHHYILEKHRVLWAGIFFACAFLPTAVYAVAPTMAEKAHFTLTKREIPYRNEYTWFLRPWLTCYRGPQQFANAVFNTVEPNAIVYADNTTVYPLLCEQEIKGIRPDVKVVSPLASSPGAPFFDEKTVSELLPKVPIYVVSAVKGYIPEWLMEKYNFEKAGPIWKVVEKNE
jgi:hypothetical protein